MAKGGRLRDRPYDEKKASLEEALGHIKTGDHIFIGSACGEPQYLVNGLIEKAKHMADNEILHVHTLGVAPYAKPVYSDRFRLNAFFVGVNTREAVAEGRVDYTPVFLSDLPKGGSKAVHVGNTVVDGVERVVSHYARLVEKMPDEESTYPRI